MQYTGYELCCLYLVYSFLGWVIETAAAVVRGRAMVNRGFATGPMCFVYGTAAAAMAILFQDLRAEPFFLFLGCAVLSAFIEWNAARLLERLHRRRWWDYSDKKWNLDGYICLQYTLLWGALGTVTVLWGNDLFVRLYRLIPALPGHILIWVLGVVAVLDQLASLLVLTENQRLPRLLEKLNARLAQQTARLEQRIIARVEQRILHAYPAAARPAVKTPHLSFAELLWLFVIGSLLGDIVETIFCRVVGGVWMSRSSLVWGPFSVVWGMALVLAAVLLHKDEGKSDRSIFVMGVVAGGAYEYICSVVGELLFGVVFWDYSAMPFNLGGRINLLYCFFWGIAAVVWIRHLYPPLSRLIGWVRRKGGRTLTVLVAVFMAANLLVSALALARCDARAAGQPPANAIEQLLDERFGDERMQRIYPNAVRR